MTTLEERIKHGHGLGIGMHLVRFTLGERSRLALVEICANGRVFYLTRPGSGDMYSSWKRVRGDYTREGEGAIIVWGARDGSLLARFDGEPVATIPVQASAPSGRSR